MQRTFQLLMLGFFLQATVGCTQLVHVRSVHKKQSIQFNKQNLGQLSPNGSYVSVQRGMGNVPYEVFENDKLAFEGTIKRDRINAPIFAASITGALILAPLLAVLGAYIANPSWMYSNESSFAGSKAFITQTASPYTIPLVSLFGVIGLLPLLGLLKAGELPQSISLPTDWGMQ